MNKDKLEKFIIERRDAFDDKEPPRMAWQKIQKELRKDNKTPRRISLWNLTKIAAAVVFILGFGIVIGRQSSVSSEVATVEENFPEFLEAKTYYETEVDEKLAQLASYNHDASLEEDMSQLDTFMEELRTALEEAPKGSEERIINAMITNYQTKLDIMERVLDAAKSNNLTKEKSKDDEINM